MKAAGSRRRAVAEVGWAGDPARIVWVAGRGLHHYWPLLSAYFREALLPPHRRADADSVVWTWDEAEGAKPATASELAALRRRLAEEQRWFAENLARGLPGSGDCGPVQAGIDQLGAAMAETTGRLAAMPDDAFAGFVCRTEHGLRLHSWSARTPACPTYPDTVTAPAAASAAGPRPQPVRRGAGRKKAWFALGGILVGIHVIWAIHHLRTTGPQFSGPRSEPAGPAKPETDAEPSAEPHGVGPNTRPAMPAPPVAPRLPENAPPGNAVPDLPAGPPVPELAIAAVMPGIAPRARGVPNAPVPLAVSDGPEARPRADAVAAGGGDAGQETAGGSPRRGPGAEREKPDATAGAPVAPTAANEIAVRGANVAPGAIKDVALAVRDREPVAPRVATPPVADEGLNTLTGATRATAQETPGTETAMAASGPPRPALAQRIRIRRLPGNAVWLGDRVLPTLPRRVERAPDLPAVAAQARRRIDASRPAELAGVEFRLQIRLRPRGSLAGVDAAVWRWASTLAPATLLDGDRRVWAEVTTVEPDEIEFAWSDDLRAELEIETTFLTGWTWTAETGGPLPADWSSDETADGIARLRIPLAAPAGAVRIGAAWMQTATGWARRAELGFEAADDVVK